MSAVTAEDAAALARSRFGLEVTASALPGEADANFLLERRGGERLLLKVLADPDGAALQDAALARLETAPPGIAVPRVLGSGDGVRLLSWVPGTPWAAAPGPPAPEALRSLGRAVAAVDRALSGLEHPGLARPQPWNLLRAADARAGLAAIADGALRGAATATLDRFEREIEPRLRELPAQALHNDANEHNVLVDAAGRVAGLIDFGDVCLAPRVCGLAVAAAYAMTSLTRPVAGVLPLVGGYHEVCALSEPELALLGDLAATRLAVSAAFAAQRARERPAEDYLQISQAGVSRTLLALDAHSRELTHLRLRAACGYEAVPGARRVRAFLASPRCVPGPVHPTPIAAAPVLDWSAGAAGAGEPPAVLPAIGRYLEQRDVYATDAFRTEDPAERRTVHLGADVFLPAGEPVLAPLDGVVHDTGWRPRRGDYGGVLVLEHRTGEGLGFFTLYGHLAPVTLHRGERVLAGQEIGRLGSKEDNGGWPPHLHLQLLTTDLGLGCDVDGVAARSERDVWESISPDPNLLLALPGGIRADPGRDRGDLLRARRTTVSAALSIAYDEPLTIVGGGGAHLREADGTDLLDMVGNVCHVGHAHPRVVAAAAEQMARLNTNTRYLHPLLVGYAKRLAATAPDPLSVVFLVNSGSEANDLALRLARAHTGRRDVIVLEHAYHGNLSSLIELSPYKFDGPGGEGCPPHVRVSALPDAYRSPGTDFAADVSERLAQGAPPAALFAESLPGVAGQIVPPPGYLRAAYAHARAAGAVVVADEVQVGLGRVGSHFWAFEAQGAVPDVVTAGKPIGNGHPLGAVITTPEVARSFLTGMEYFNTFGGNPVSCATGLAVLDVIADERLQARAAELGERLLGGLGALALRHEAIGDVRGLGLFIGVELVRDRATREPDPVTAKRIVERCRRDGVLLSTDGPHRNVIKLKPPLALTEADADRCLAALAGALEGREPAEGEPATTASGRGGAA